MDQNNNFNYNNAYNTNNNMHNQHQQSTQSYLSEQQQQQSSNNNINYMDHALYHTIPHNDCTACHIVYKSYYSNMQNIAQLPSIIPSQSHPRPRFIAPTEQQQTRQIFTATTPQPRSSFIATTQQQPRSIYAPTPGVANIANNMQRTPPNMSGPPNIAYGSNRNTFMQSTSIDPNANYKCYVVATIYTYTTATHCTQTPNYIAIYAAGSDAIAADATSQFGAGVTDALKASATANGTQAKLSPRTQIPSSTNTIVY